MKKQLAYLLALLMLSGCAVNSGPVGQGSATYYPMCYSPLQQARRLDSQARDIAEGAGRGLLLGALAGLAGGAVSSLFSGNAMNIVSGAAIGAAGGVVAGGVSGGMNDNQAEKDALVAQWSQEAGEPLEGLGFNGAAATWSIQCYNQRLKELEQEVDAGIISRPAAEPRLVEIELGRQEAYSLLNGSAN